MSEAATPEAVAAAEAAAKAAAAPAPATGALETVTLSKEEHERLVRDQARDAARAASAQSRLARYEKGVKSGKHFGATPTITPKTPTAEELEARNFEEDQKAERGLLQIAIDPAYRDVLDADPTLRAMLTSNPLSILPLMAADAFDAEDAITLVKEALEARRSSVKKPEATKTEAPSAEAKKPEEKTVVTTATLDAEYEAAKKNPNTERAIASMIGVGLKKLGQK